MNNIVLVGFMGSGKTTVGRELARRLDRSFIDLDADIEVDAGKTIDEIFAAEGEAGFREHERRILDQALQLDGAVIASGGGAPLADDNWRQIRAGNTVIALMAEPAELARRLAPANGRPLLKPDPNDAIARLLPQRLPRYLAADLVVRTDNRTPDDVAARLAGGMPSTGLWRIPIEMSIGIEGPVPASHEVVVGSGLASVIASSIARIHPTEPVVVITDETVSRLAGKPLRQTLEAFGMQTVELIVPVGETAKELSTLHRVYDRLAAAGVDRQGLVVALGGGSVGDTAGFIAATWMRGIRYIQVPTTLLAMVDSSIGGKTAINLAAGKNMVGAVHQPVAIFCDLDYLQTLPEGEFRAALAEIIKSALIADRGFVDWLIDNLPAVLRRDPPAVGEAVRRAVAIKARIVSRDPKETGERSALNYGHTIGHALERVLGYGTMRHGEAVAWGMEVAARISVLSGTCPAEAATTQHQLLQRAGLLTGRPTVGHQHLLDAVRHDKKARGGEPRWVLLRDLGAVEYGRRVDPAVIATALNEVLPS